MAQAGGRECVWHWLGGTRASHPNPAPPGLVWKIVGIPRRGRGRDDVLPHRLLRCLLLHSLKEAPRAQQVLD